VAEIDEALLGQAAIHVHGFYPDLLPEIISSIGTATAEHVHIEVTACSDKAAFLAERLLRKQNCRSTNIVVVPNRGRDLGPLFTASRHLFDTYKYIAHVHTK
jgi:lipopolysaccharide biosynthesis protein